MTDAMRVVVASRSPQAIDDIRLALTGPDFSVQSTLIINGDVDPLRRIHPLPDVLVLRVTDGTTDELDAQARRAAGERCPMIVVSGSADPAMMRAAMQAGARDYLVEPLAAPDLAAALLRIAPETSASSTSTAARSVAFVGAKGGSGTTFIAANVAHLMRAVHRLDTVLVDLDLQFGSAPHYLDVPIKRDLLAALSVAHELDVMALDGYMARHGSGLHVMAAAAGGRLPARDALAEPFATVLDLLQTGRRQLVLDVPSQVDVLGILALERVDKVAIVLQQSLPALRNAARLLDVLRGELHLPQDRLIAIVNRYRKGAAVDLDDIDRTLNGVDRVLIPNHYPSVSESIEMGVPIHEHAPGSPVTKELRQFATDLSGRTVQRAPGLLAKAFGSWIRSTP